MQATTINKPLAPNQKITIEKVSVEEEIGMRKVIPIFSVPDTVLLHSSIVEVQDKNPSILETLNKYLSKEKEDYKSAEELAAKNERAPKVEPKDLLICALFGEPKESIEIIDAFKEASMEPVTFPYFLGAIKDYEETLFNMLRRFKRYNLGLLPAIYFGHPTLRLCLRLRGTGNNEKLELFQSLMFENNNSLYICSVKR